MRGTPQPMNGRGWPAGTGMRPKQGKRSHANTLQRVDRDVLVVVPDRLTSPSYPVPLQSCHPHGHCSLSGCNRLPGASSRSLPASASTSPPAVREGEGSRGRATECPACRGTQRARKEQSGRRGAPTRRRRWQRKRQRQHVGPYRDPSPPPLFLHPARQRRAGPSAFTTACRCAVCGLNTHAS